MGKFMRKWICILLAAGIAVGLMSGCSRNVGTQESAVWQVLETEILAEKADASGEVDFTHDYSEEIKADIEDVVSKSDSAERAGTDRYDHSEVYSIGRESRNAGRNECIFQMVLCDLGYGA